MAHIFSGKEKNDARLITWALETTRKGNVLQRPEFVYDVLTHFGAHITLDQVETIHGLMTHLIQNLLAIHQIKPSQPDSIQEIVTTAATRIRTNKSVRTPQNPVAQKMADYYPRHSQVIPPSKEPMIERRKTQLTPTERVDKMLKQFIENPVLKPADIQYILPSIRLFSQK
ncbi:MAG: hypothetical protein U1C71_01150, partial [archaeon]|nr:hypothetical protein [archaeon]